jgi:hypothetical protein
MKDDEINITVHISPKCSPETLQALGEMMCQLIKNVEEGKLTFTRAGKDDPVIAKNIKAGRIVESNNESVDDDLFCSEHQCPKNLVDYDDGSCYECPECQRERGEALGLQ